jgi:hypothetical protein
MVTGELCVVGDGGAVHDISGVGSGRRRRGRRRRGGRIESEAGMKLVLAVDG